MAEKEITLSEKVYLQIRMDILSCRLPPSSRLNITSLCKQHEVSLGAVREALARLSSEGFVRSEPQQGFKVAEISAEELADLTEVRTHIECLCLKHSIENGDISWEADLVASFHRMSRTPQRDPADQERLGDNFADAHRQFHSALVSACNSPWLLRIREGLYAQSERYRRLSLPLARIERDVNSEHKEIMDAALAKDIPKALALLESHLTVTTRVLLDTPEVSGDAQTAKPKAGKAKVANNPTPKKAPRKKGGPKPTV
jgi:DNA-binding GntR family transcriptional regulator